MEADPIKLPASPAADVRGLIRRYGSLVAVDHISVKGVRTISWTAEGCSSCIHTKMDFALFGRISS